MAQKKFIHQLKEIGFGSRSFSDSDRIIRKDGEFNIRRRGIGLKGFSTYHWVINMPWPLFLLFILALYFALSFLFALVYYGIGVQYLSGLPHDSWWLEFVHCFYFSTQTLTTVGFGHISPTGSLTSLVAAIEAMVGLMGFALATGILYGRFSKAKAKILQSEYALVSPYRGTKCFKFRIANMRRNNLIDMSARVLYSYIRAENGVEKRRYLQLPLEIDFIDLFPLPWTIVHPIDEESPLYGKHVIELAQEDAEFIVIVKGYDDTFNQYVHQVFSYKHDEVMFDADFQPMFESLHGATEIDLEKISSFKKVVDQEA